MDKNERDIIQNVKLELLSAMSSLNMEPEPIEDPKGIFLCERDKWVEHSLTHIHEAFTILGLLR